MTITRTLTTILLAAAAFWLSACQSLPGTRTQQTTGAGTAIGAAVGASAADNDLVGALLGGAAGAAGGYLIGARTDWFGNKPDSHAAAQQAVQNARMNPATVADVRNADTADLNGDGFVTMDELIAMHDAGLNRHEIVDRLQATNQVFELSDAQKQRLIDAGLSRRLVAQVQNVNRGERQSVLGSGSQVISRNPS